MLGLDLVDAEGPQRGRYDVSDGHRHGDRLWRGYRFWRPRGRRARARQAALFLDPWKRGAAPLARRPRSVPRGVSPTCSREFSADYLSLKSVRGPSTSFHPKSAESRFPGAREPSSGKVQLRVAVVSAAVLHLASGGLACVHRTPVLPNRLPHNRLLPVPEITISQLAILATVPR